jgi:predicted ATPase/DNA-binding winged helix-turn-helix (wHTH) protein
MNEFPPFRLDRANQCVWRTSETGNRQRLALKPKAYEVLAYLAERAGQMVTQDELLRSVWPDTFVQPEVLKRQIFDIRTELGDDPKNPRFIETLPRRGYRFIAVGPATSSNGSADGNARPGIAGRAQVLSRLEAYLLGSLGGRRQIVFVTGEMGIGKSATVEEFQRRSFAKAGLRVARGQCLEGYSGKEAYYPLLKALASLCRGSAAESTIGILAAHAPTWLVQLPFLVDRQRREALEREISGATQQRMLRELGDAFDAISMATPLLLILEDLHWADHSTIDFISATARRRGPGRLMLIATFRAGQAALSGNPIVELERDLLLRGLCHELPLGALSEVETAAHLHGLLAEEAPRGLVERLHCFSEGNPLFVEAAVQQLKDRGFLPKNGGDRKGDVPVDFPELEVPDSLRAMVETQLDCIGPEHLRVLEAASVVGNLFCSTLSACVGDIDPEDFEQCCVRLSRLEPVLRPAGSHALPDGSTSRWYEFVHSIHREVLYQRISPVRRALQHRRAGEQLEQRFAEELSSAAPHLARHFELGGDWVRAIKYLLLSAEAATLLGAPRDAAAFLERALGLMELLPEAERDRMKSETQRKLAVAYATASAAPG